MKLRIFFGNTVGLPLIKDGGQRTEMRCEETGKGKGMNRRNGIASHP